MGGGQPREESRNRLAIIGVQVIESRAIRFGDSEKDKATSLWKVGPGLNADRHALGAHGFLTNSTHWPLTYWYPTLTVVPRRTETAMNMTYL